MSIAKPHPHDSAPLHVSGRARYVDDIPAPPGTLHLAFGLSPVAHGRIRGLDLTPVRAAPGVVAALAAGDLPRAVDVAPVAHDEPMLAEGTVNHVGQPLFMVIAESHLAARRAARLAEVGIDELPAILTIEEALAADSRFEEGPRIWQKGDARAAIANAAHVVDGTMHIGGQEHFYLEGQAALALPGEAGEMTVHVSSQHPSEIQHKVADALGLAMHDVRVEVRRMGGAFGGKESQANLPAVAAAVAAAWTGRPCRVRYDRDDDFTVTGKRHDFRIDYRVGTDAEGRILGAEFVQYARCGWAQDLSLAVADRAMLHADNAYLLPAARIESHRLRTHTQSATAFRGFGGPQGMVPIERVMQAVARRLGRDPLEVRRANFYPPAPAAGADASGGSIPAKKKEGRAAPGVTPYGQPVGDCLLDEMVDALNESADYAARRAGIARWNAASPVLKRAIALTPVKFGISFTLTHLNQAGALVHVYRDGSIRMNHGGTEMGQGLFRKVAQVAAREFDVPLDRVKITATDTGQVPNTSATAASSGSDLNGMAVQAACAAIRGRIAGHLGELHQCPAEEVRFEAGRVIAGANEMSFAEAVESAYLARVPLSATGFYKTPDISWDRLRGRGVPFYYFAYGAAVSEVAVDRLTGEHRLLRVDILHDAGASLNPALDIGQVEGGFVQGAGWLTSEELVWDSTGRLTTHAPSTYKIPACSDRPAVFNVRLWEKARNLKPTIHRSKAVGEPPLMLAISVLMALEEAVAACGPGAVHLDPPATPEKVLDAIGRAEAG